MAESGLSEAEYYRNAAIKEFGYTPYFYDAGYILPNGKMLNFSGQKNRHFGTRGQDHRAVGVIYSGEMSGSEAMVRFMSGGNIRIMAESPGVDIISTMEPTAAQYKKLREFIRESMDEEYFNVDFTDENGNTVGNLEYEGTIRTDRVVNDIKRYFQTGEIRQQSSVAQFHGQFSKADVADSSNTSYNVQAKAEQNFRHLAEVLENDNRSDEHRRENRSNENQGIRRLERSYRESQVAGQKERKDICNAIRRANGFAREKVSLNSFYTASLDVIREDFYTAEMIQSAEESGKHGYKSKFFFGNIILDDGYVVPLDGFADTNTGTIYVKYDASNGRNLRITGLKLGNKGTLLGELTGIQIARQNARHERFHLLNYKGTGGVERLFKLVNSTSGKYAKRFAEIHEWYKNNLEQDDYGYSDYSGEIAADLYARNLRLTDRQLQEEVEQLIRHIDGGRDIRFSREDVKPGELAAKLRESERALAAVEKAHTVALQQLEYWREQSRIRKGSEAWTARKTDIQRFAKALLSQYPYTTVKASQITERIQKIADGFMQEENTDELFAGKNEKAR